LNGVFDDLDSPFEGASLFVGNRLIGPSDSNGQIATEKIRGSRLVPVKLNRKTIPNPYIVEVDNGYFTSLRPNSEVVLNVPVIETGVIDGFIKFSNGSVAPNLRVQLIDNDHNVVNEVTTLFDGFYNFDFVRPGKYSVRLDPSYKFSVPPVGIQVTSENLFLYGTDLTIMEQAKEVRVSALAEEEERGIVPTSHSSQTVGTELPAPSTLSNRIPVAVNHVWTGELIDKGSLILLLSGPADYEIEVDNAADHIEFKFKNAIWDTTNSWGSSHMPHIYSFIADISITNEPILKLHMKDNSYISSHFIERIDGGYKLTINFENDN
jgi:hypothetical protein